MHIIISPNNKSILKIFLIVSLIGMATPAKGTDKHKKDTCFVGLYIKNLYDLRPEEYSYSADFWMWVDHKDTSRDPLTNIEVINAKQSIYTDQYHANSDSKTWLASESGRVTLIHDWKLENYPFDKQNLRIDAEAGLDTSKIILLPAGFRLYKELILPGWEINSYQILTRQITYDSDFGERLLKGKSSFSRITYEIEISRHSWGLFFKLLIGVYVSFLVAFLAFFLSPSRDQRLGLSIGGLFAAIANKYVMDNNIPVSTSFSFVDRVHVLTFVFILLTLILSIISLKISKGNQYYKRLNFDRKCGWIVGVIYISLNAVLIIWATKG